MAGWQANKDLHDFAGHRIAGFRLRGDTDFALGTGDWRRLFIALCVFEYEALERLSERNQGDLSEKRRHPVLQPLSNPDQISPGTARIETEFMDQPNRCVEVDRVEK